MHYSYNPYSYQNRIMNYNYLDHFNQNAPCYITNRMFQNYNEMPQYNKLFGNYLMVNNILRKLWFEHVMWTKLVMTAILKDSPDTTLLVDRLVRNSKDFEEALSKLYGIDVASRFGELLKEHIVLVGDYITNYKKKDEIKIKDSEKKMYSNANDIADYLSEINPYLNKSDFANMMYSHLDLIRKETQLISDNKYLDAINLFEKIESQALEMADALTYALSKQFFVS